jgi:microcin C transport system substrate-binding protein
VVLKVIRDTNIALQHFLKGELDTFWVQRPEWWHDRAKGPEFDKGYIHKLWFYTDNFNTDYYIVMNTKSPPFDNKDVRIAMSHAINVDKVSKTVLRGDYERLNTTMDGYEGYTNPNVKARPYDAKKVDEHLKKAGWDNRGPDGIRVKNGQKLSVTLTYSTKAMEPRLVVFKEEAKKVGIELNLKLMDGSAAFKSAKEKQHQMYYAAWAGDQFPTYWEYWHSENAKPQTNNFANLTNKELDKLIDQQRFEQDEDKRKELSRQIQQMIHDEAVAIHLWKSPYFRESYWAWIKLPEVQGTKLSDSAPFGQYIFYTSNSTFWIDEEVKKEVLAAKKAGKKYSDPVVIINKKYKK